MRIRDDNEAVAIDDLRIPRRLYEALIRASEGVGSIEKAIIWALEDWAPIENQEHPGAREKLVEAAIQTYQADGAIEIDRDGARVSFSELRNGAYVQGWLRVDDEGAAVAPSASPRSD